MLSLQSRVENFNTDLWGYYAPVSGAEVADFIADGNRRMRCTINGKLQIHCALMPMHGDFFVLLNKEVRAKLGLRLGEPITLLLEKDESEYGMPMPDELAELFYQDEAAKVIFDKLTPGKQRSLIYLVTKLKNTDSRLRKALAIAHHLKESGGKLDYKQLNETMKHYSGI